MRITVKTAGLLGKYLPAGSRANLAELDIAEGATPIDVMRTLGMPEDRTYLVVLNGENLPTIPDTDEVITLDYSWQYNPNLQSMEEAVFEGKEEELVTA